MQHKDGGAALYYKVFFFFFYYSKSVAFLLNIDYANTKVYLHICKTNFYFFAFVAVSILNSTWVNLLPQKNGVALILETTKPSH